MANLKMPQINNIIITGNLTRDVVFKRTSSGTSVSNFIIASNKRYRDLNNEWQEDVCFIGIVAWNKLADSCAEILKKGSAVLVEGELQTHVYKSSDNAKRSTLEIKAHRIQFLNRRPVKDNEFEEITFTDEHSYMLEDGSFDKFLTSEESQLLKEQQG